MVDTSIIARFESFRPVAYADPKTGGEPWTIGFGTTHYADGSAIKPGDTITFPEAIAALDAFVQVHILPALARIPGWAEMSNDQRSALVSFAYNCGPRFYGSDDFETITRVLRDRDWAAVPGALLLYDDPNTNVTDGLLRRRRAEGALWRKGMQTMLELNDGDIHMTISHAAKKAQVWRKGDPAPGPLFEIDALTSGVGGGPDARGGDTPPGDYLARGVIPTTSADSQATWDAYGAFFVELSDMEGQESSRGRAGIGMHGGGTALGPVGSQAPRQAYLCETEGCIRLFNIDLAEKIVPLVRETLHSGHRMIVTVGA